MKLTLPFPPLLNRYYFYMRGGRVLSKEGKAYKVAVALRAKAAGIEMAVEQLILHLGIYRKAKRGDIDGGLKAILDAGNGCLWRDDGQISALHVFQQEDKANPRVELEAWEWSRE